MMNVNKRSLIISDKQLIRDDWDIVNMKMQVEKARNGQKNLGYRYKKRSKIILNEGNFTL